MGTINVISGEMANTTNTLKKWSWLLSNILKFPPINRTTMYSDDRIPTTISSKDAPLPE